MQSDVSRLYEVAPVRQARADLALALRAAAYFGLGEGVCNHFSLVVPGDARYFLLNPQGLAWSEVSAADVVMVDASGARVAGPHPVESSAMHIHAAVHRRGRACVLHTHMPYATALATLQGARFRPCASQNALRFHGRVQEDVPYDGLALDAAGGETIARGMGDAEVAFLSNHGVIVTGKSVAEAFEDLYYLERAAMNQVLAMSTGVGLREVPLDVASKAAHQFTQTCDQAGLFLDALRRRLPEASDAQLRSVTT